MRRAWSSRTVGWVSLAIVAILAVLVVEARRTAPVRGSLRTFTGLIAAANHGDREAAERLCTTRFLRESPIVAAPEGGFVGLPRGIHPNFRAWRAGDAVWVCPTNRIGPVFQFREENGLWRFDGLIGRLDANGGVDRLALPGVEHQQDD